MVIATLTLNPALDIATSTEKVEPTHKLRCTAPRSDPGGGGINVARVIHALGGSTVAVFPQGGGSGATFAAMLREEGIATAPVPITGAMRESLTVDEKSTGQQYRFVMPGPVLSDDELHALIETLVSIPQLSHLVLSGSLPPDCDPQIIWRLAQTFAPRGVKLVVDTSGDALKACKGAGVHLLKPSLREAEQLLGQTFQGAAAEVAAAQQLHAESYAELIVLSLGERGAVMVTRTSVLRLPAIPVEPVNAVGAGDSMVAAVTLALARGHTPEAALRYGIAAGAVTLMTAATDLPDRSEVERLYAAF